MSWYDKTNASKWNNRFWT